MQVGRRINVERVVFRRRIIARLDKSWLARAGYGMIFSSLEFIFGFLPITFAVFVLLGLKGWHRVGIMWLVAASLLFYGWWNPAFLPLLLGSILFNYGVGYVLSRRANDAPGDGRAPILWLGIVGNLALLGYFKYAHFVLANISSVSGLSLSLGEIILPLGISFFTFTQIAFLVDAYRGRAHELNVLNYCLFVTYFPHLIAGPVLHHREMMPQFARPYRPSLADLAVGMSCFVIGLFKKVVLADGLAPYATAVFHAAGPGVELTFFEVWGGVLAYSFQIYFDFSGYSDMAVGISRMFGVKLPINFYSPYQAHNIIDFWRRWHMTLSRFLRDYLYIPLGGGRRGEYRRYANLMTTMLLGGLWHGASWTFVIWGGMHGLYLAVNHGWRRLCAVCGWPAEPGGPVRRAACIAFTFFACCIAWVFFRASTLDSALTLIYAMAGGNGISLPAVAERYLGGAGMSGLRFDGMFHNGLADWWGGVAFLISAAAIVWLAPNTQQIFDRFQPTLDGHTFVDGASLRWRWYCWRPTPMNAVFCSISFAIVVVALTVGSYSEFLYFQF